MVQNSLEQCKKVQNGPKWSKMIQYCIIRTILFQIGHFSNIYGTSEFHDYGNLVGADCMGNLRWANKGPSMHFRKTNMDPSVHLRKANTDPSVYFRKASTEFLLPVLLPNPNFTSKFTPSFISNYEFVTP